MRRSRKSRSSGNCGSCRTAALDKRLNYFNLVVYRYMRYYGKVVYAAISDSAYHLLNLAFMAYIISEI